MDTLRKLYLMSERPDAELEKIIYEMSAEYLRVFLYGVARGWGFDESCSIAVDANFHHIERIREGNKNTNSEAKCPVHNEPLSNLIYFECGCFTTNKSE